MAALDVRPHQKELERLCREYGVEELSLFDSALREDFDAERSDVDFLVTFRAREPADVARVYFGLIETLERLLGREVELLSLRAVRNPYLKASIEAGKETLYAA